MKYTAALALMGAVAHAHYIIPIADSGGSSNGEWVVTRKTTNWQDNNPVTDVTSDAVRCYELSPGTAASETQAVTAGDTVTFTIDPAIYHPGPVQVYMAKAPSSVDDFDGDGTVWFKIYEDPPPEVTSSALVWESTNKGTYTVTVPACVEDGEYLIRFEQIALHVASTVNGAQLYISCSQISVTGGSGSYDPTLMAFPGAYSPQDPGLLINIYYPIPTNYTSPGGPAMTC